MFVCVSQAVESFGSIEMCFQTFPLFASPGNSVRITISFRILFLFLFIAEHTFGDALPIRFTIETKIPLYDSVGAYFWEIIMFYWRRSDLWMRILSRLRLLRLALYDRFHHKIQRN